MDRHQKKKMISSSLDLLDSLEKFSKEHVEHPFYQVELHNSKLFLIGPDREGKITWFVDPMVEGGPDMTNMEFPEIEDVWDDLPEDLKEFLMYNMDQLADR
jgi:hypothetical protein